MKKVKEFIMKNLCSLLAAVTLMASPVAIAKTSKGKSVKATTVATQDSELYSKFKTPAQDMTSKPLFFWNTTLEDMTEEKVREIVRRSYQESGYSGFGILPFWQEGYLSDRYFELYEAALDEGSKYGMKFSLYDENGYPSYTAGGLFAKKYPELTAKRLDKIESSNIVDGKIVLQLPQEKLMGVVAYNSATKEMIDITDQAVIKNLPELDVENQPIGITATSQYNDEFSIEKAFDGDINTRWNAADYSGGGQYIIVNYGKNTKVDRVELFEDANTALHRVKGVEIQYWDEDTSKWVTLGSADGITNVGANVTFDAVEKQYYRIYFRWVNNSASINEINFYADGQKVAIPANTSSVELISTQAVEFASSSDYSAEYSASKAFDGDVNTRWNSGAINSNEQWLAARFGKEVTINTVQISESSDRINGFSIQYLDGSDWKTCATGTTIGANYKLSFDDVTTTAIRLLINTEGFESWKMPSIIEFKAFKADIIATQAVEFASSSDFSADYNASKAFDGDANTRWNSSDITSNEEWIAAKFGKEVTINTVEISEQLDRINGFSIQYLDGTDWKTCATGTTIGANYKMTFNPVTTTGIRLLINTKGFESWKMPSIIDFKAYNHEYKGSYIEYPVTDNNWKLMAFVCVTEGVQGMDYFAEEAVAGFIEITYDEYYKRFKKYFDNGTITSAFYDEPSWWGQSDALTAWGIAGGRMWTEDFAEVYKEMFGDDTNPLLYYPAMWEDIGEKTTEARDKINAVRSEMFAKHYIGALNDWCTEHGIELMGHMLYEDMPNPVPSHGDLMYCFKYQDCPTVDVIASYGMTEDYFKIISSSAYNWDHAHVGVECYGAIPDQEMIEKNVLYKQAMDLYAKGINVMVPHAVWYNENNVYFAPELSYRTEPYASQLKQYNEYIARLQTMLQEGRHIADIAVLYPIDTLEAAYDFNRTNLWIWDSNYVELGTMLSEQIRKDFTYLHPSIIDEKVTVNGNTLHMANQVNYEDFKVMILPSITTISKSNLEKIKAFYDNGGSVISVGGLPYMATEAKDNQAVRDMIAEMFGESYDSAQTKELELSNQNGGKLYHITKLDLLAKALELAYDNYDVNISNANVTTTLQAGELFTYIHKYMDNSDIYFFANSSNGAINPTITLRGEFKKAQVWDPMTGEKVELSTTVANGKTTFNLSIDAVESLFVVVEHCEHNFVEGVCDKCGEEDPNWEEPTSSSSSSEVTSETTSSSSQEISSSSVSQSESSSQETSQTTSSTTSQSESSSQVSSETTSSSSQVSSQTSSSTSETTSSSQETSSSETVNSSSSLVTSSSSSNKKSGCGGSIAGTGILSLLALSALKLLTKKSKEQ